VADIIDCIGLLVVVILLGMSTSGECTSGSVRLAAAVALILLIRSAMLFIKVFVEVRRNKRYELTQGVTMDFADVRQSFDSEESLDMEMGTMRHDTSKHFALEEDDNDHKNDPTNMFG
jgi:hypothetical protein